MLIGPSAAIWGRRVGDVGRVRFVTCDGDGAAPVADGRRRPAKVLRVELV